MIGRTRWIRGLLTLAALAVVFFGVAVGALGFWAGNPVKIDGGRVEVQVKQGDSLGQAIASLQSAGMRVNTIPLKLLARQMSIGRKIKPGYYSFEDPITPITLLDRLRRGDVVQVVVSFPEGWTFRQMRERLDQHGGLRHDTTGKSDPEIMKMIGAEEVHAEGWFFPDTYRVEKGASDAAVLRLAYALMKGHLQNAWQSRSASTPLKSAYEALILASIVEKESGRPEDRAMIASVFTNRLRIGMRLQTDPTVIYGLGTRFDGNLRKRDLLADNPYNTYTRGGLPPTPIAMPGLDAIQATVNPPASQMLYFVARGDGSSEFSPNLQAHNRAVDRYQRGIR